jgi:hypothetical protein
MAPILVGTCCCPQLNKENGTAQDKKPPSMRIRWFLPLNSRFFRRSRHHMNNAAKAMHKRKKTREIGGISFNDIFILINEKPHKSDSDNSIIHSSLPIT